MDRKPILKFFFEYSKFEPKNYKSGIFFFLCTLAKIDIFHPFFEFVRIPSLNPSSGRKL